MSTSSGSIGGADAHAFDDVDPAYDALLAEASAAAGGGVDWDAWRDSIRRRCPPAHLNDLDGDLLAIELLVRMPPTPR